jgi:putative phage-type endonuclease
MADKIIKYADRDAWLAGRSKYIGASEGAAVLGVSPWDSPYAVWQRKVGQGVAKATTAPMRLGNELEGLVLEWSARHTGRSVSPRGASYEVVLHPEHDCIGSTLDARQHDKDKGPGVNEAKVILHTADEWQGADPPVQYQVQLQQQLACTGLAWGSISALLVKNPVELIDALLSWLGGDKRLPEPEEAGCELKVFDMDRRDDFLPVLVTAELKLWTLVEKRIPPPLDGSSATAEAIKAQFGVARVGAEAAVDPIDVRDYARLSQEVKDAESVRDQVKARMLAAIGDAEFGVVDGKRVCSWKNITQNRSAQPAKTITFRRFDMLTKGTL